MLFVKAQKRERDLQSCLDADVRMRAMTQCRRHVWWTVSHLPARAHSRAALSGSNGRGEQSFVSKEGFSRLFKKKVFCVPVDKRAPNILPEHHFQKYSIHHQYRLLVAAHQLLTNHSSHVHGGSQLKTTARVTFGACIRAAHLGREVQQTTRLPLFGRTSLAVKHNFENGGGYPLTAGLPRWSALGDPSGTEGEPPTAYTPWAGQGCRFEPALYQSRWQQQLGRR